MYRVQPPARVQFPSHATGELLRRMPTQMESLTISFNMLRRANDNRIEEISKLAVKVGCSGEVETDREMTQRLEVTNDSSSEEEREDKQVQENLRFRNKTSTHSLSYDSPSLHHHTSSKRTEATQKPRLKLYEGSTDKTTCE